MAKQIIKQPNGLYCLFSSYTDTIIYYNCSKELIIDYFVEEYREKITNKVNGICDKIEKGDNPYHQFTMSFEDALETIKIIYGEEEVKKILSLIEKNI